LSDQELLIPEGSVLVHIGPYKTGTTAIQASLGVHRDDLAAHGVLYPGRDSRQFRPGWGLLGRSPVGVPPVPMAEWDALVEEVRGADAKRVCISTEDLVSLGPAKVQKLVDDLGPEKVHMVVVARGLDRLLPSAWQQRVKSSNEVRSYDQWLREVLTKDTESAAARTFWHNHGLQEMFERWRAALPVEQTTVIVADETDRTQLHRVFERLLGLPEGLLQPGPRDNSSLTFDRVELYRRVNAAFDERGWSDAVRRQLIHRGMLNGLRRAPRAGTDLPIPPLPAWAAELVAELSGARVEAVATSGARIVGDPESLRFVPADHAADIGEPPAAVSIDTAALAVEELVHAALKRERRTLRAAARRQRSAARAKRAPGGRLVETTSSKDLLREVARRQRGRLRRS